MMKRERVGRRRFCLFRCCCLLQSSSFHHLFNLQSSPFSLFHSFHIVERNNNLSIPVRIWDPEVKIRQSRTERERKPIFLCTGTPLFFFKVHGPFFFFFKQISFPPPFCFSKSSFFFKTLARPSSAVFLNEFRDPLDYGSALKLDSDWSCKWEHGDRRRQAAANRR